MAAQVDVLLGRDAGFVGSTDALAFGNTDLGLDQIEAGDHFGDGVFDLDARVHFDEVELAGFGVHQEFDGACADVIGGAADGQRRGAQALAGRLVEVGRRRAFDHLLVAALDGAVAFEQMDQIAVFVAEDLHLDVAGMPHQLFEIDLVLAERALRFAACGGDRLQQHLFVFDRTHAAPAAAPGRLEHHRVADFAGHTLDLVAVVG